MYNKHNFKSGDKLMAAQLNEMDDGIEALDEDIGRVKTDLNDVSAYGRIIVEWEQGNVTSTGISNSQKVIRSADYINVTGQYAIKSNVTDDSVYDAVILQYKSDKQYAKQTHLKNGGVLTLDDDTWFIRTKLSRIDQGVITVDDGANFEICSGFRDAVGAIKTEISDYDERITDLENRPVTDPTLELRVEKLEAAAEGNLYMFREDEAEAYEKAVPADAMKWATLDKVGGKTLVWNQLIDYDFANLLLTGNSIFSVDDKKITVTGINNSNSWFDVYTDRNSAESIENHRYLVICDCEASDIDAVRPYFYIFGKSVTADRRFIGKKLVGTFTATANGSHRVAIYGNKVANTDGAWFTAENINLFDLTAMGVPDITIEQFLQMFPSVYPRTEPTLMTYSPETVVSRGRNLLDIMDYTTILRADPPEYVGNGVYHFTATGANAFIEYVIDVTPGTKYRVCAKRITASGAGASQAFATVYVYDGETQSDPALLTAASFTTGSGAKFFTPTGTKVRIHFSLSGGNGGAESDAYQPMIWETADNTTTEEWYYSIAKPYFKQDTDLSSLVSKYFPNGMRSAGDVHDSFEVDDDGKVWAVQRVGSVIHDNNKYWTDYNGTPIIRTDSIVTNAKEASASGSILSSISNYGPMKGTIDGSGGIVWHHISGVSWLVFNTIMSVDDLQNMLRTTPVIIYYELADYIRTEVTEPFQSDLLVEAGGSLTFVNDKGDDYRVPLPNAETWMIKLGGANA